MNAETDKFLSTCVDLLEQQDDIIYRMSSLLKRYVIELNHARNLAGIVALDDSLAKETEAVQQDVEKYVDIMGA